MTGGDFLEDGSSCIFFLYFVLKHRPRFFFSLEIPAFRLYFNAKYKYKSPARHFFNWTF